MIIAILGRLPALGIAECERVFGSDAVDWFGDNATLIAADALNVEQFGGIVKAGRVVAEFPRGDWHACTSKIVRAYDDAWHDHAQKITLGISAYGFASLTNRDVQKIGLVLKARLKRAPGSLRLVPNDDVALSSATSHHNKLGLSDSKVELLIVRDGRTGKVVVAESLGAQNITALAERDQGRPKRDAFVGMLPPKLGLQMINLAVDTAKNSGNATGPTSQTILDPFCGTGVILQEALLRGFSAVGSDLSEKMIRYSRDNLTWLQEKHHLKTTWQLNEGDAMTMRWQPPIDAVACEAYLGQPFSAPPSSVKLHEVRGNCDHIISDFLKNIGSQIPAHTPLCVAIPAWRDVYGRFTHLSLIDHLEKLGYQRVAFKNITNDQLLYYRETQVVARELLVLQKL